MICFVCVCVVGALCVCLGVSLLRMRCVCCVFRCVSRVCVLCLYVVVCVFLIAYCGIIHLVTQIIVCVPIVSSLVC